MFNPTNSKVNIAELTDQKLKRNSPGKNLPISANAFANAISLRTLGTNMSGSPFNMILTSPINPILKCLRVSLNALRHFCAERMGELLAPPLPLPSPSHSREAVQ